MTSASSPIKSMPRLLIGAVVGVVGLFGVVFEDNWNYLIGNLIGEGNLDVNLIHNLNNILPTVIVVIGVALMLSARNQKLDK